MSSTAPETTGGATRGPAAAAGREAEQEQQGELLEAHGSCKRAVRGEDLVMARTRAEGAAGIPRAIL